MTVVCPGPIETSNNSGVETSEKKGSPEVSSYYNMKGIKHFFLLMLDLPLSIDMYNFIQI